MPFIYVILVGQDCDLSEVRSGVDTMSDGGTPAGGPASPSFIPLSPPKCEVDDSPLHGKILNKNKECE